MEDVTPLITRMERQCKFLVVLETMWGPNLSGGVPRWFCISPHNNSGKRLYKLTGTSFLNVWVTNCCKYGVDSAREHAKPQWKWLRNNLFILSPKLRALPLLVCGKVAGETYGRFAFEHEGPVLELPHPAARKWSRELIAKYQAEIQKLTS